MLPFLLDAVALASTFRELPDLAALRERSRAVVLGTVVDAVAVPARWGLVTTYTIAVERTLAGDAEDIVTVVLPGGRQDGLTQVFSDVPVWSPGDAVLVFLPHTGDKQALSGLFTVDGDQVLDPLGRFRDVAAVEAALLP